MCWDKFPCPDSLEGHAEEQVPFTVYHFTRPDHKSGSSMPYVIASAWVFFVPPPLPTPTTASRSYDPQKILSQTVCFIERHRNETRWEFLVLKNTGLEAEVSAKWPYVQCSTKL